MNGQTLSEKEYQALVSFTYPTAVSLCIPTDSKNPDPRTNSITFKNAINRALSQLQEIESASVTASALDQACEHLLNDDIFWKEQAGSFVMLAAGDQVKTYKLTSTHPELVMIADHYYILPFISQFAHQSTFYLLELDKEHTQMWRGTESTLEKITVPDLPTSIAEVTGAETERNLQSHTSTAAPQGGMRAAMFHGSSTSWKDDHDRYLERFLQAVDSAVVAFLKQKESPLLISGVEEASVLYRKVSRYEHLLELTVSKIPDPTHKEQTLHEHSWKIVSDFIAQRHQSVLRTFEETIPAKKVTDLSEILRQASQGKVDTLLVAEDARVWGAFDVDKLATVIETMPQPQSVELLNLAARLTLTNSGAVLLVPQEQMPEGISSGAILRY